jgi:UDP-N-acetylglucosamine--N-acetylmuramyl-(pentapeptide) pyrophosphoryl-undecaprenol N-acetylglucosamine transferase
MTTMMVASTGGHLSQLVHLEPRLGGSSEDRVWVTFDTPQSRSLLGDQVVEYVRYTAPRDYPSVLRNLAGASRLLERHRVDRVISTGSAIALSYLPVARARRVECHYIESIARSDGPSMTGRVLARVPGIHRYSQYAEWASDGWAYGGSVFDAWKPAGASEPRPIRRVVVTLGTIGFPFRRLVERVLEIVPDGVEVYWQTGRTGVGDLPIEGHDSVDAKALETLVHGADAVIAHAGSGSAILALESGRCPVLVPREARHGEHVDDHQVQVMRELAGRHLCVGRSVEELEWSDVVAATRLGVGACETQPFGLATGAAGGPEQPAG